MSFADRQPLGRTARIGRRGSRGGRSSIWRRGSRRVAGNPRRQPDSTPAPALDFSARPAVVAAVAEATRLSYGHLFNPAFATEVSLIDPPAPPAHRRLRADARPVAAPLPAGRRRRSGQDDHDRPVPPGGARPPPRPARARRAASRAGRQLGAGAADALLAAVPHRPRRRRARRQSVRGARERPGDRERRHAGRRARVRAAAGGGRRRARHRTTSSCSTRRTSWPPTGSRTSPSARRIATGSRRRWRGCRPTSRDGSSAGRRRTSCC